MFTRARNKDSRRFHNRGGPSQPSLWLKVPIIALLHIRMRQQHKRHNLTVWRLQESMPTKLPVKCIQTIFVSVSKFHIYLLCLLLWSFFEGSLRALFTIGHCLHNQNTLFTNFYLKVERSISNFQAVNLCAIRHLNSKIVKKRKMFNIRVL